MQTTNAPGKLLLLIPSILLILAGVFSILGSLLAIVGGGILGATGLGSDLGIDSATASLAGGLFLIAGIIGLINSIFKLISGVLGVKNANKPEKAQVCFVLGIIMLILPIILLIITITTSYFQISSLFSALAGLVIPALYTFGAYKNKTAV